MTKARMRFLLISDTHGKLGVINDLPAGRRVYRRRGRTSEGESERSRDVQAESENFS